MTCVGLTGVLDRRATCGETLTLPGQAEAALTEELENEHPHWRVIAAHHATAFSGRAEGHP